MSTSIVIGPVRLSFFHGWEPKAPKGSTKLQYSSQLLFDADDKKTVDAINQAIAEAREEGKAKLEGTKPSKQRNPVYDGEEEFPGDPNYKGKLYLNASNTKQPEIVKKVNGKIVPIIEEDEAYSGMYAYVAINFFAYNNVGVGVGCSLQHVMKYKDGERLDGRISAEKAFEGVDFGSDDEDDNEPAIKPVKKEKQKKEVEADEVDPFAD